ncbi:hypothetical protein [Herbaspirillum sp.]|uniref:hypothetical protein n=1 Tax=Herbaspirillum sp. TaxID=1890675 RepID=UPI001B040421|nr:hypothetical protein [Herbaspirillum sp.]MBO9537749.1 hypothetical protein [Herbaspirillum sp.]
MRNAGSFRDYLRPLLSCLVASLFLFSANTNAQSTDARKVSSKRSYQQAFCDKFEMAQDTVDVETLMEDMAASPYPESFNEFWTTPACHAPMKNDTEVPIIFNTASDPVRSENFPGTVHDYFIEDRKDRKTWLQAINTTTSDGYTFLDYLQYNIERGHYSLKRTQEAAGKIIAYVCRHGGVYAKYKNTVKCSAQP